MALLAEITPFLVEDAEMLNTLGVIATLIIGVTSTPRGGTEPPLHAPPQTTSIDDTDVKRALDALVTELLARHDSTGHWEPATLPTGFSTRQSGGHTALVALALVHAGVPIAQPQLSAAIHWLLEQELGGTYAVALRASLIAKLPHRYHHHLGRDVQWLITAYSHGAGGWDYVSNPDATPEAASPSIRQYAVAALRDATRLGHRVPQSIWRTCEVALEHWQVDDGGWGYHRAPRIPSTGSMTASALLTLQITSSFLAPNATIGVCTARGNEWMEQHFNPAKNTGATARPFYFAYLYGVERWALAEGLASLGGNDWFAPAAAYAIKRITNDNGDGTSTVALPGRTQLHKLAFATLFLARGRVPILLGSVDLGNHDPMLARQTCRLVEASTESPVAWIRLDHESPQWAWSAPPLLLASSDKVPSSPRATRRTPQTLPTQLTDAITNGACLVILDQGSGRFFRWVQQQLSSEFPDATWSKAKPILASGRGIRAMRLTNAFRTLAWVIPYREGDHACAELAISMFAADHSGRLGKRTLLPPSTTMIAVEYVVEETAAALPIATVIGRGLAEAGITPTEVTGKDVPDVMVVTGTTPSPSPADLIARIEDALQQGSTVLVTTLGGRGGFAADLQNRFLEQPGTSLHPLDDASLARGGAHSIATARLYLGVKPLARRLAIHEVVGRWPGRLLLIDTDLLASLLAHRDPETIGLPVTDARSLLATVMRDSIAASPRP